MKALRTTMLLLALLAIRAHAERLPAEVLDLRHWTLTLPYAAEGKSSPIEISAVNLQSFRDVNCFHATDAGDGVVFRAYCTKTSTKNSSYPRCELRELRMSPDEEASWSTHDPVRHRMSLTQAVTAVPPVKPHVVAGQIHTADDDLLMIRLEGRELFIERDDLEDMELDPDYVLGTKFTLRIEACGGHVKVWYNDALKLDWEVDRDGCYFKAGCYTQSNFDKGDTPESFGEVVVYTLEVTHDEVAGGL